MPPSSDDAAGYSGAHRPAKAAPAHGVMEPVLRAFALSVAIVGIVYIVDTYLVFWRGWPGLRPLFAHYGWFGLEPAGAPLDGAALTLGWLQVLLFVGPVVAIGVWAVLGRQRTLRADAEILSALAAYIARGAYWAVLFVGLADTFISFLRVEGMLDGVVGVALAESLGRAIFRGEYVHYPLIAIGFAVALFTRGVGFIWLALLVVVAELQIVIFRFIFSYEQAFMADLVRFWYGALFLFASAYTLLHEGHVRVDIVYASMGARAKAWSNAVGSLVLGAPVCWVVLTMGMSDKTDVINGPMLNYEITQAGFGMYVKYLMAGFLAVYALTMLLQFMSYFLNSAGILLRGPDAHLPVAEESRF